MHYFVCSGRRLSSLNFSSTVYCLPKQWQNGKITYISQWQNHIYPCDSDGYQNEILRTNSQTEYTNKWSRWCVGQLQCRLADCRNLTFFIEMICYAPWFSQVQSTGFLSVFLEHSLMYLWWYYFLICFVSYSWLIRTLSYSKLVGKKIN